MTFISNKEFFDKFTLKTKIGQGAEGNVFIGHDNDTGKEYVFKICNNIDPLNQCNKEWNIYKHVTPHENIIKIFQMYKTQDLTILLLEKCDASIFDIFYDTSNPDNLIPRKMSEEWIKKIIKSILKALVSLKRDGVIHRDIKPENILLCNDTVKLIDFGLAKFVPDSPPIEKVGTPDYMAPEIIYNPGFSNVLYDYQIDVHSTGVLLYELVTGFTPYNSKEIANILEKIKTNCRQYDNKLMDKSLLLNDLIDKMIGSYGTVLSGNTRITVEQALEHDWFNN